MNSNSKLAWEEIKESLPRRQKQVFTCIKANPGITIREIAVKIKRPAHTFSGRCKELKVKGLIIPKGEKKFRGSNIPHDKLYINRKKVRV
jgi:predicted transcriptional regulator